MIAASAFIYNYLFGSYYMTIRNQNLEGL